MRFIQRRNRDGGRAADIAPDPLKHIRARDDTPPIDPVFVARLHADLHRVRRSTSPDAGRAPRVQSFPHQQSGRIGRASRLFGGSWIARSGAAALLCLIIVVGYRVAGTPSPRENAAQPIGISAASTSPSPASGNSESTKPVSLHLRVDQMPAAKLVAMLASVTLPPGTEISRTALAGDGPDLLIVLSGILTVQYASGEQLVGGNSSPVAGHPSSSSTNTAEIALATGEGMTFQPGTTAIFSNDESAPVVFVHATIASPRTTLDASPAGQSVMAESTPTTAFSTASGSVTISFDRILLAPGAQLPQRPETQILSASLDKGTISNAAPPTILPALGSRNTGPSTVAVFVLSVEPPAARAANPTPTVTPILTPTLAPTLTPGPIKTASAIHPAATKATRTGQNGQSGDQGNSNNSVGGAQGSGGASQDVNQSPGQSDQSGSQGPSGPGDSQGSSNSDGNGSSIGASGGSDQTGSQGASGQNDQSGNQSSSDQSGIDQSQNSIGRNGGINGSGSSDLGGNSDAQGSQQNGQGGQGQ